MRIGLSVNPASGSGRGARVGAMTSHALTLAGFSVSNLSGRTAAHARERLSDALHSNNIDCVVTVGGDGTIHCALQAIGDSGIPIGHVGVGSGNDIARHLGLPVARPAVAVGIIVDAVRQGRRRNIDLMRITGSHGETWGLAIVSAGADAVVNHMTNQLSWPRGPARYVRALAQYLPDYTPYGYEVTVDGKRARGQATLVAIANTQYFGGGMRLAPQASSDDGVLDAIMVRGLSRFEILTLFPRLYNASHVRRPDIHFLPAREVTIAAHEVGPTVPIAMVDGEEIGPLPISVRVVPRAGTILQ